MKKFTSLFSFLLFAAFVFGQSAPVAQMVREHHSSGAVFQKINLFAYEEAFVPAADQTGVLQNGVLLTLDEADVQAILEAPPQAMEFVLPTGQWGHLTLELVHVNIFSPDFRAVDADSGKPIEFKAGAFYRGIIKGNDNSLASIAISGNEVMGFVSDNSFGNLTLGKMEGFNPQNKHLVYADKDLTIPAPGFCEMADLPEAPPDEPVASDRAAGDCINLWIEVDRDLTNNKGGVTQVTTWITSVFNQVITLYANESIEVGIHHIEVWSGGGGNKYTGGSSSGVLTKFQNFRYNSFTGNLAILCNLKSNLGGIAAGFAGLCNSNKKQSMCFAGLQSTYQNVPAYSWTVMVCTHELGHLFSSRHTHACVWNGNNTALDNCYTTEGGCAPGPAPTGGGTIMSYCHLTSYGINFNNGFGSQPGNKIRGAVTAATCTAANCTTGFGAPGDDRNNSTVNRPATVTLTPNPASDQVRIDLEVSLGEGETGNIRVYNVQGVLVGTRRFDRANQTLTLETGNMAPGLYFVDIATATENLTARLIVK